MRIRRLKRVSSLSALCALSLSLVASSGAFGRGKPAIPEGRLFLSSCPSDEHEDGHYYCVEGDDGLLGTGLVRGTHETPPEIFTLERDRQLRQVTDNELFELGRMVWSPDGSRFVVSADPYFDGEECRLYVVRARDGSMTPITPRAELACPSAMDWSQDGRWILMSVYLHDGPTNLYKVRPDGSGLNRLTQFRSEGQDAWEARWIDKGRSIVFRGYPSMKKGGIYVTDADGKNRRPLVELSRGSGRLKRIWDMAVSPDRRHIAYVAHDGREETTRTDEVFLIGVDGSGHRRLTFNSIHETALSWAPDSRRLAIVQGSPYETEPETRISIVDVASGASKVIRSPEGGHVYRWSPPAWSPSGRYIAFTLHRRDGTAAVYTASATGSWMRRVTSFQRIMHLVDWRKWGES